MEMFRQWLRGVIACAIFVSILRQICPEGSVRQSARFIGSLLLLYAMLRLPAEIGSTAAMRSGDSYREAVARLEQELGRERETALSDGIAAELGTYIENKAAGLGSDVRAEVSMETRGGTPVPARVTLRGAYSGTLANWLASELGITKERQEWIESG